MRSWLTILILSLGLPAALAGCLIKKEAGSSRGAGAAGSCASGTNSGSGASTSTGDGVGRISLIVDSSIDPCSIRAYVVGQEGKTAVSGTDSEGNVVLNSVSAGQNDIVVAGTLATGSLSLNGQSHAIRVNSISVENGAETKLGTIELPPVGAIGGRAILAEPAGISDFSGIDVYIPGTSYAAKTDEGGAFRLVDVPVGVHQIVAERDGYTRKLVDDIAVQSGSTSEIAEIDLNLDVGGTGGGLILASGAAITTETSVPITFVPTADAVLYKLSESSLFSDTGFAKVVSQATYTFKESGHKHLFVQYANANGLLSSIFEAEITVDLVSPEVLLHAGDGNGLTRTSEIAITITGTDQESAITDMMIGRTPQLTDALWEPYKASVEISVPEISGPAMFFAKVRDAAGRESKVVSSVATIDLDAPAPPSMTVSSPISPAVSTSPELFGSSEAETTVSIYSSSDCTGPILAVASAARFLGDGVAVEAKSGRNVFSARAIDLAGNTSDCSSPFVYSIPERLGQLHNGGGHGQEGKMPDLVSFKGKLFYDGITAQGDIELWSSDGSHQGTAMVKDIFPGGLGMPGSFAVTSGSSSKLFFAATEFSAERELWVSDGTAAGTHLVSDILPGDSSDPKGLVAAGGFVYFTATDADHGREVWRSDGTAGGTTLVAEQKFGPTAPGQDPTLFSFGTKVFFGAGRCDGPLDPWNNCTVDLGTELWVSTATATGTTEFLDFYGGMSGINASDFFEYNGMVHFRGRRSDMTEAIFRTDGTIPGTVDAGDGAGWVWSYANSPGKNGLYRTLDPDIDGKNHLAIWTPNGGNTLLAATGSPVWSVQTYVPSQNLMWTVHSDGVRVTNGTVIGTSRVMEVTDYGDPYAATSDGAGGLFLAAAINDGQKVLAIYHLNADGTWRMIFQLPANTAGSGVAMAKIGENLFVAAMSSSNMSKLRDLWVLHL